MGEQPRPREGDGLVMAKTGQILDAPRHRRSMPAPPKPPASQSRFVPLDAELRRLCQSRWHGSLEFDYPDHLAVHPGVFSVITEALGRRPHFSACFGRTVFLTMAIEDDSSASERRLDEIAVHLAGMMPNAVLRCVEIEHSVDKREPTSAPALRAVEDHAEV